MSVEFIYIWTIYVMHISSLQYIWGKIFGWKYRGKHQIVNWLIITALCLSGFFLIRTLHPVATAGRAVVTNLFSIVFLVFPYNGSLKNRVGLAVLHSVVLILLELMEWGILLIFGMFNWSMLNGSEAYYQIAFYYMIYYVGIMLIIWAIYVKKKYFKGHMLFLVLPCYQIFLAAAFFLCPIRSETEIMIVGIVTVAVDIFLDVGMIWALEGMIKHVEREEKFSTLYNQRLYELDYYRCSERHMEEIRRIRHEFMNQIQTAYFLLRKQAAKRYENIDKKKLECKNSGGGYCKNPVLNSILLLKAEKAKELQIKLTIDCTEEDITALSGVEICSLFGNLLDNAVEACCKLEPEERCIALFVRKECGEQIICCRNTVKSTSRDKFWETRKKDKQWHGVGLKVIEQISEKYHGTVEKKTKDGWVNIEIILPV